MEADKGYLPTLWRGGGDGEAVQRKSASSLITGELVLGGRGNVCENNTLVIIYNQV